MGTPPYESSVAYLTLACVALLQAPAEAPPLGLCDEVEPPGAVFEPSGAEVSFLQWSLQHTSSRPVDPLRELLPVASMLAASALLSSFFWHHCRAVSAAQTARSNFVLQAGVQGFLFSVVILESFDLCKAVGATEAMSGQMVGVFQVGMCCGAVSSFVALRLYPELWRKRPRTPLFLSHMGQLIYSLVYLWVAAAANARARHGEPQVGQQGGWHFNGLMLARWLGGLCSSDSFGITSSLHLTPVAERGEHVSRLWLARLTFFGVGPLVAAALLAMDPGGRAGFCLVGCCQLVTAFTAAWATSCVRSLEDVQDCVETGAGAGEGRHGSRVVVWGCLLMGTLRSMGVSGLEVGLTLEWEELYHWDQRVTGLVTGATFLVCIPIKALHGLCGSSLSQVSWIYLMSTVAVLGAGCLFLRSGSALICSAALVFPCLWLSDALGASIMYQHVLPEGSYLDSNHTQLFYGFFACLPRYLGCWLARLTLHEHGPCAFALQCMVVIALFPVVFCFWVRPSINRAVWELIALPVPEVAKGEQLFEAIKGASEERPSKVAC